ncbi:MAG: hypothetical protein WCY62_06725 [Clostridia bacterium]|jgi:uncharacterized membrane protein
MVDGKTLLGYDDKPKKAKDIPYRQLILLVSCTSILWVPLILGIIIVACVLFTVLVLTSVALGFAAVTLLVYSVFLIPGDMWPSIIKIGASVFACGISVLIVTGVTKGLSLLFRTISRSYHKFSRYIQTRKLEETLNDQNS